mmetsp:Transcript_96126/g.299883  ORF Transcript_96126/g.299883 Transcript_96126/m.299883 type:complete len:216 (+) Transcript_96126:2-649(+)
MAMPIGIIGNEFTHIWENRDRILLMIRTRERLGQWGYTARDMARLFRHFDEASDGLLHINEFRHMMDEMQIGLSAERIVELFDSIDMDHSGAIDVKEFIHSLFPSDYCDIYGQAGTGGRMPSSEEPKRRRASPAGRGSASPRGSWSPRRTGPAAWESWEAGISGFAVNDCLAASADEVQPASPRVRPLCLKVITSFSKQTTPEFDSSILPSAIAS